jgi:vacuolar iron transporter family protein
MVNPHAEAHRGEHAGWRRAAVLGANDGLVSTASLMVGVAASGAAAAAVLTAAVAGPGLDPWPWRPESTSR